MRKNKLFPYLLILPFVLLLIIFRFTPIVITAFRSFFAQNNAEFVYKGLDNFKKMFTDPLLGKSIINTFIIFAIYMIISLPILIIVAYSISKLKKGKKIYLSIFYLPTLIGAFAFAIIYRYLFTYDGLINSILFSIFRLKIKWLEVGLNAKIVFSLAMAWGSFGMSVLLLVNTFNSVPQEVIDSALIDGAKKAKMITHIILPYAYKVLRFVVLTGFIATLNLLELPFNLTQGAPNNETVTLGYYIYKVAFSYNDFSYASTIGLSIFIFGFMIIVIFKKLVRVYAKNN